MESGKETANVYRNREFRIYLATRFLMTFGIQMQNVITGWYLYELTKDPLILGMVGLSEALPALSSALFAGDLVDKFDKRNIYQEFADVIITTMQLASVAGVDLERAILDKLQTIEKRHNQEAEEEK